MSTDGQKIKVHTFYTYTKKGVDLQGKIEVFQLGSAKCMPAMAIVGSGEKLVGIWKKVVRGGHWAWNFPEVHGAQVVSGHSIIPYHTIIDLDKYNKKYMLSLATRTLERLRRFAGKASARNQAVWLPHTSHVGQHQENPNEKKKQMIVNE